MLNCCGDRIQHMWFSGTGACTRLNDKAISLEADQVSAHGVIGEPQFGCQLVDRPVALPKQTENFPAGAFDQPLTPW